MSIPADAETDELRAWTVATRAQTVGRCPTPVGEPHGDCSCVDLELSISELLTPLPRLDAKVTAGRHVGAGGTGHGFCLSEPGLSPWSATMFRSGLIPVEPNALSISRRRV